MKTIIKLSIFLLIILAISSCSSSKKLSETQHIILPLSDSTILRDGSIVYGLPRTVLTVKVEMERTIEKPGPYSRYADDLLGLSNIIKSEGEYWSIESITVNTHEELDPSEYYIIESNTLFQSNVLALRKEGLILDLNQKSFLPTYSQHSTREEVSLLDPVDLGSDEYFLSQKDTAYKRLNIDSTFIRIPYIVEKKKKLTVDQLAERAARRLMEMRDGKHLILTGEANVFPQSDAAINEMNNLEKEYTELFTGKSWKHKMTFSYTIIPNKEMLNKQIVLFQFSELTGPGPVNMNGGIPVSVEFIPEQKSKDLTILSKSNGGRSVTTYDKLFYRVPDVVNVKITAGPDMQFNSRRLIYQFGQLIQLPANFIIGR